MYTPARTSYVNLRSYQDLLLGKTSDRHFRWKPYPDDEHIEVQAALDIIRYGVEDILHWTPYQVIQHMTPYIARTLHWDMLFARGIIKGEAFIHFEFKEKDSRSPDAVDLQQSNWRYLMHLCYPKDVPFSFAGEAVREYRAICQAKRMSERGLETNRAKRFSRDFIGSAGRYQEAISAALVTIIVKEYALPVISPTGRGTAHDLYRFFADPSRSRAALKRSELYAVMRKRYVSFYEMLCLYFDDLYIEDDPFWRKVYALSSACRYTGTKSTAQKLDRQTKRLLQGQVPGI